MKFKVYKVFEARYTSSCTLCFRYLQQGCTQYFGTKETEKNLPASRKSQDQLKKGSLKDPMQDDYRNYQNIDKNLKNIGMSDTDRQVNYYFGVTK